MTTAKEELALADEIEKSDGLVVMQGQMINSRQLGIKRTAMVIAALRSSPTAAGVGREASDAREFMETAWKRVLYDSTLDQEKAARIFELATINGLFDPYSLIPSRRGEGPEQMLEYARRLNDIAVNCEMAAFEGDASDLRRIADQLALAPPSPTTVAEPVAWRWKLRNAQNWIYDPTPDWRDFHKDDADIEMQPLYAAVAEPVKQSRAPVQAPAERQMVSEIPFDPTNHHNALKCPYCNPKGLCFAVQEAPKGGAETNLSGVISPDDHDQRTPRLPRPVVNEPFTETIPTKAQRENADRAHDKLYATPPTDREATIAYIDDLERHGSLDHDIAFEIKRRLHSSTDSRGVGK